METIEESRRQLRQILSRRDFMFAAGGALASSTLLGLAGCGGAGGGQASGAGGAAQMSGLVTLPTGSKISLATASVDVFNKTVPLTPPNKFTVTASASGPSLALLLDGTGNPVMAAMLDPAASSHSISPHTTSVALLYFGIGGHYFPAAVMSQILELLDQDPAIATLASVVGTAIVSDPYAVSDNAASIGPAITAALTTILGGTAQQSSAVRPATTTVPTLMSLTPTDAQDGVMVSQADTTTSLLISNTKRRPCKVYVYETTTLTGSQTTDITPAQLVAGPIDLDSTENLGVFTSLKDFTTFFHGTSPWSPVNLPAIPLQLATGTDRTTYQVIVLASSFKVLAGDTYEPSFFRDSHFTDAVATWRKDDTALFYTSLYGGILLPIFCFFGGFGLITASNSVIAAAANAPAVVASATFQRIISQLQYGSIQGVTESLAAVVQDAVSSNISTQFWKTEVQEVIGKAEAKALEAASLTATSTRLSRAAKMFLGAFGPLFAAGLILDGFDLGAVIYDVYNSDIGASWTALLVRQLLGLKPLNPVVNSGDRVSFTVSLPANVSGTFEYVWTQSSPFATLSAVGEANVGQTITTKELQVDLLTTGSDKSPINVLVIGYDTSSGQNVEIGRAGTTVSFLLPAQITPSSPALAKGTQQVFSVSVDGTLPSGVTYQWTLTGSSGTIGSSNVVTTKTPQVTYIADEDGSDTLQVQVLAGSTLIAKASVVITVGATPSIQITVAGTWDSDAPPVGSYTLGAPDPNGARLAANATTDAITFVYDVTSQGTDGVILIIAVPKGQALTAQETFPKVPQGTLLTAGQFVMSLESNLNNPDGAGSTQFPDGTAGSLQISSLGQLNNGSTVVRYTFSLTNDTGGIISGSGVGVYPVSG